MILFCPPGTARSNPPPRGVVKSERKIALCGSHSASLRDAPWNDSTWEFWGHASSRAWYARPMHRYFDLHPRACWVRGAKKITYPQWLAANTVPIYMQQHYQDVPASVEYPKGRVLLEFSDCRPYFANHVSWMIALALTEGVSTIGMFGVNYGATSEYVQQRGSCEFWIGRAAGRGVRVLLPEQCTLLREPALLYGYESHNEETGELRPEYRAKLPKGLTLVEKSAEIPADLKAQIALEDSAYPRPSWALGPLPPPNGRAHTGEA